MKIVFNGEPPVSAEGMARNVEHCRALGLRAISVQPANEKRLAIVGGGPSVLQHVEELKGWDGDILAINGACAWLRERGIDSTFFSLDPDGIVAKWAVGATKALLCSRSDPKAFEVLKDADVQVFHLHIDEKGGIVCGTSTATAAFHVAAVLGYRKVTFFGCESSYEGQTHLYFNEHLPHRMVVKCGENEYLTRPDFYVQAQELSEVIRLFPSHFEERCGGLLGAMVKCQEHDVTQVSPELMKELTPLKAAA
ncbi:MAG TPA: 6-hydroxymethylpterin diphosphokinase MptE-like protein [Kofleriaceae bacterium]